MIEFQTKKQQMYLADVVKLRYEESKTIEEIEKMLPIGRTTILNWLRTYSESHDIKFESPKRRLFDQAIELCHQGVSITAVSKKIGISRNTISKWLAIFEDEKRNAEMAKKESKSKEVNELKAKVAMLELELKKAELARDAYDEMINVAEAMFNIPIRKKAGAKQ